MGKGRRGVDTHLLDTSTPDVNRNQSESINPRTKLIVSRERIKEQVIRFSSFVSAFTAEKVEELEIRTGKIEPLLEQFEEIQLQLDLLDPSSTDSSEEREEFEGHFYAVLASAKSHIKTCRNPNTNQNSVANAGWQNTGTSFFGGARLPKLGLPKFAGDFEKWTQFFETFQTLVDNNQGLDEIQKFYYLLDCLEGNARKILDCLEITRSNYSVALDLLKKRYQHKAVIIQKHIKSLVDMPPISKEGAHLLRTLNDAVEKHVRALKSLGEPVDTWDRLLIFIISRKLDMETKKEWEEKTISSFDSNPKLSDFIDFVANKCRILETVDTNLNVKGKNPLVKNGFNARGVYAAVEGNKIKCEICKGSHFVYRCEKLINIPVPERAAEIRKFRLCYNCLRSGHMASECRSDGCRKCHGRHNTLLHPERETASTTNVKEEFKNMSSSHKPSEGVHACLDIEEQTCNDSLVVATSCSLPRTPNQVVILSTAVIYVKDSANNFVKCRALLDSGSQMNFMSLSLAKQLNLKTKKINVPISGVNEMLTNIESQTYSSIKSCYNSFSANVSFLVLKNITSNIPVRSMDISNLDIPSNLKMADPDFNISSKVDVLLGAGLFFSLLCVGQIRLGIDKPLLQKSVFGWIISGPMSEGKSACKAERQISCHTIVSQDLENQLEKFWIVEEVQSKKYYSKEEADCEQNFIETFSRNSSGRFCVTLPIKDNVNSLGESLSNATNRFYSIERKLSKNAMLREQYVSFMEEYIRLGHMSKLRDDEIDSSSNIFYLPHHGVINDSSVTTKLRVVFDASAKSSTGVSLNDILKIGPCIQDDLFDILVRFRQHSVVITSDIAKMYRQVEVAAPHRELQRILWRPDPHGKLEHYRLNTVTYGTSPASFLATRCLKQIAIDIKDRQPEITKVILSSFYVDDLILSVESVDKAVEVGNSLLKEFSRYGFPLRKWSSNRKEVLKKLSYEEGEGSGYLITDSETRKTLGLFWQAGRDILNYVVKPSSSKLSRVTKRVILSVISQIFDPLGLVGPVTIKAKILLQRLWQLKIGWDEAVPIEMFTAWNEFYNQLVSLNELEIPRQCTLDDAVLFEIHGFSDASERSYGACVYLRTMNKFGNVLVSLICAKSRVAPIKHISLPRLELCGAVLLAQLVKKVVAALDLNISNIFLWTDSTIVLSWLAEQPNKWKVFVANRVAEIQDLTQNCHWGHVLSSDNPADIISRGVQPQHLNNLKLWWSGPVWLEKSIENWPKAIVVDMNLAVERREVKVILATTTADATIFERYSCLYKLVKVVAMCIRFFKKLRDKANAKCGKISCSEFDNALITLLKVMQSQEFATDIKDLKKHKKLSKQSAIAALDPFIDSEGLLRVGGRLRHSKANYNFKFPILLPQHHAITKLIILDQHHKQLHAGPQAILAAVRQSYWPIHGRSAVRSILSKCITCFRIKPVSACQKMGDLPEDRVIQQRPFLVTGVDFAGPFNLKDGKLRNRAIVKAYVCLFICFTTKAVHIELVGDLSSNSFLNALKRFVSRRGLCARIYSDNATNFVGANNELQKVGDLLSTLGNDNAFNKYCLEHRIKWKFIPPRSPHHGGLWESAVKSAKHHLVRTIKGETLTFECMSTVLTQVEAVLNSRPLTPLSSNPNDFLALTPSHFLIGDVMHALPQRNVLEKPLNRLDQYHQLQSLYQNFWSRWSNEYLSLLQQRTKWKQSCDNLQPGNMVLLKEENLAPLQWRLGRVLEVHPGPDQKTRVVSVQTNVGIVKRSVQKLCVLPMETEFPVTSSDNKYDLISVNPKQ